MLWIKEKYMFILHLIEDITNSIFLYSNRNITMSELLFPELSYNCIFLIVFCCRNIVGLFLILRSNYLVADVIWPVTISNGLPLCGSWPQGIICYFSLWSFVQFLLLMIVTSDGHSCFRPMMSWAYTMVFPVHYSAQPV